jgi:hypothetical protein
VVSPLREGATTLDRVVGVDRTAPWFEPRGRQQRVAVGAVVQHLGAITASLLPSLDAEVRPERIGRGRRQGYPVCDPRLDKRT